MARMTVAALVACALCTSCGAHLLQGRASARSVLSDEGSVGRLERVESGDMAMSLPTMSQDSPEVMVWAEQWSAERAAGAAAEAVPDKKLLAADFVWQWERVEGDVNVAALGPFAKACPHVVPSYVVDHVTPVKIKKNLIGAGDSLVGGTQVDDVKLLVTPETISLNEWRHAVSRETVWKVGEVQLPLLEEALRCLAQHRWTINSAENLVMTLTPERPSAEAYVGRLASLQQVGSPEEAMAIYTPILEAVQKKMTRKH